jgi:hypothetical protein
VPGRKVNGGELRSAHQYDNETAISEEVKILSPLIYLSPFLLSMDDCRVGGRLCKFTFWNLLSSIFMSEYTVKLNKTRYAWRDVRFLSRHKTSLAILFSILIQ